MLIGFPINSWILMDIKKLSDIWGMTSSWKKHDENKLKEFWEKYC